jgi:hypothetical protein
MVEGMTEEFSKRAFERLSFPPIFTPGWQKIVDKQLSAPFDQHINLINNA